MRFFGAWRIRNPPPRACAVATTSKYVIGTNSRISISRRHAIASVGVFTRPMPITSRAPRPSVTVAVRVSERL